MYFFKRWQNLNIMFYIVYYNPCLGMNWSYELWPYYRNCKNIEAILVYIEIIFILTNCTWSCFPVNIKIHISLENYMHYEVRCHPLSITYCRDWISFKFWITLMHVQCSNSYIKYCIIHHFIVPHLVNTSWTYPWWCQVRRESLVGRYRTLLCLPDCQVCSRIAEIDY